MKKKISKCRTQRYIEFLSFLAIIACINSAAHASDLATVSPFKFSGFVDMRYSNYKADSNPNVTKANAESGFGIEDGAVQANYEKNRFSAILDIAFRRGKEADIILPGYSGTTVPNQSNDNRLSLAIERSQLYLKYKLSDDFAVNFGQFDTIFGVEVNDSKDRIFGKTGLVYDSITPVTHTGAMIEYANLRTSIKFFAANPINKGSNGTSPLGEDQTEYGAALGYSNEKCRAQIGYMSRPTSKASSGRGDRTLLDATLGVNVGSFVLDFEYSLVSDPNKNTLTTSTPTDLEKAGQGFLVLATYKVTEPFSFSFRYEQLKDDPAKESLDTVDSSGVSIHYKVAPELELRTEYIAYRYENLSHLKWSDSRFNLAAVAVF